MTTPERPATLIENVTEQLLSLLDATGTVDASEWAKKIVATCNDRQLAYPPELVAKSNVRPPLNLWAEMLETVVGRERFDERGHQLEKGVVRSVASEMRAFIDELAYPPTTHEPPAAVIDKVTEQLYLLLAAVESRVMPSRLAVEYWSREIVAICNEPVQLPARVFPQTPTPRDAVLLLQSAALKLTAAEWDAVWHDAKAAHGKMDAMSKYPAEFDVIVKLDALTRDDPEQAHDEADGLLRSLVHPLVQTAYDGARERVGFWYA